MATRNGRYWPSGLHRILYIMDGMTLVLPTKLTLKVEHEGEVTYRNGGLNSPQDPRYSIDRRGLFALQSDSTSTSHTTRRRKGRPMWGSYLHEKSKQLHAGAIRAYDEQTDKYSVQFQYGRTVEWELAQVLQNVGQRKGSATMVADRSKGSWMPSPLGLRSCSV